VTALYFIQQHTTALNACEHQWITTINHTMYQEPLYICIYGSQFM